MSRGAVYAGCGTDVLPLLALANEVSYWVLLDSQPASEFGHDRWPGFERPNFLKELKYALNQIGYLLAQDFTVFLIFEKPNAPPVYMWPNTALPISAASPTLLLKLSGCDTVCVCGHDPHESLLQLIHSPRRFVTNFSTALIDPNEDGIVCQGHRFATFDFISIEEHILKSHWTWIYRASDKRQIRVSTFDTFDKLCVHSLQNLEVYRRVTSLS